MSWVAVGVGAGTAVAGIVGSKQKAKGAYNAKKMMAMIKPEAEKSQASIDPWNQYRADYASQLNDILTGKADWTTDPGYQFRMDESNRAVERSGFSKGYGKSGNLGAALQQRSQDIASAEYGNIINRLTNLAAATPQNAIAGGQQYGNMMTSALTGQAQAAYAQGVAKSEGTAAAGAGLGQAAGALASYFGDSK